MSNAILRRMDAWRLQNTIDNHLKIIQDNLSNDSTSSGEYCDLFTKKIPNVTNLCFCELGSLWVVDIQYKMCV